MLTVYDVLYSALKSLIYVILCKYRHGQSGESIHCPCKIIFMLVKTYIEPVHDKTNKMTCVPSEASNQPDIRLS